MIISQKLLSLILLGESTIQYPYVAFCYLKKKKTCVCCGDAMHSNSNHDLSFWLQGSLQH